MSIIAQNNFKRSVRLVVAIFVVLALENQLELVLSEIACLISAQMKLTVKLLVAVV